MPQHASDHIRGFTDVERVVRTSQHVDEVHADDDAIVGRVESRWQKLREEGGLPFDSAVALPCSGALSLVVVEAAGVESASGGGN